MNIIKVSLKKRSYNIIIGNNIVTLLGKYLNRLKIGHDAYVITNMAIKKRYGRLLNKSLRNYGFSLRYRLVPDTEKSKSIDAAFSILGELSEYDKKRELFIIALGGGVIGDLSGFTASIYKRGVAYIQVPTTLLAQVDSSIGGKTAVDLIEAKNLVGTFYQPRLVFSDIVFLKTLDSRQIKAGLAEVIKYGIIKSPRLFSYLEKNYKDVLSLKPSVLEFIVKECSYIKAEIVRQDEREKKGIRTILNFGHTLGHAIEAAGNYKKYNHGEALSLGMLLACDISKKLKLTDNELSKRIENLIRKVGLPHRIKRVPVNQIIAAHYHDKKFIGTKNRFVLVKDIAKTKIVENIPLEIIREALKRRRL